MDPSTEHDLGYRLSYTREDCVNNAGKRKDPEEPGRKTSTETSSFSQGPGHQVFKEQQDTKRVKLSPGQEDKSEDWSSEDQGTSGRRSDSDSGFSEEDRCSLVTVEDLSGDTPRSFNLVISNPSGDEGFETDTHRLSSSDEDQENSSALLDSGGLTTIVSPRQGTALTSSDHNNKIAFQTTYKQEEMIGQGGYGSVFAGYRKHDKLPVAMKFVPVEGITYTMASQHGAEARVPLEVALLLRVRDVAAVVTLLDWYDLGSEVVLVLERPEQCMDLFDYVMCSKRDLEENSVQIIVKQLVDAFVEIHSRGVLHRDLHFKNVLIESCSAFPRVRIIDFGCGSFLKSGENKEPLTVFQIGQVLRELLDCSSDSNTTEDCQDFLFSCLMLEPESRPGLQEFQRHPWLNRLNQTSKDS